jgi:hypothetical protein
MKISHKFRARINPLLFVPLFILGGYIVSLLFAAGPMVTFQGENGAVSGRAGTRTGDPSASGSGYIEFGAATSFKIISQIIGIRSAWTPVPNPPLQNDTFNRYNVGATDLGIMWQDNSKRTMLAFGDTFGDWNGPGGSGGQWRSNVLAISSDINLTDGLTFDSMVTSPSKPNEAKEIIDSPIKKSGVEISVLPTTAISVGSRSYIHYVSLNKWGIAGVDPEGTWFTNYSGIAFSDDGGQNWVKHPTARWNNTPAWDHKFQQAAFERHGGFIYMFGTANGRRGQAYLARVPEARVMDKTAYQYWNKDFAWVDYKNESAASPIFPEAGVGEMSVRFDVTTNRWLLVYGNSNKYTIVLRTAPSPTGPWSAERYLIASSQIPGGLYGGYIHPLSKGSDLYLLLSVWNPYAVFLTHVSI